MTQMKMSLMSLNLKKCYTVEDKEERKWKENLLKMQISFFSYFKLIKLTLFNTKTQLFIALLGKLQLIYPSEDIVGRFY